MRNCGRLRRSGQRRGGTDRCEAVLTGADRCGPVRTGAGRCRPVQARPGRGEAGGRVRGPRRTAASRTWREIEMKKGSHLLHGQGRAPARHGLLKVAVCEGPERHRTCWRMPR
nr:uncharacterized protein LOC107970572 isoform X3 [Pan troglodytes]